MKSKLVRNLRSGLAVALLAATAAAQAGMALIAHPSNQLAGITADDAARIYLGKTTNFPNGRPAAPVDQATHSAMRAKFYYSVVKKDEAELKAYWSKLMFSGKGQPPRELTDDVSVKSFVASNPDAIGYVDGKVVDATVKVLLIVP
jgi:ABC-type phosphate transport system substrate-binding protein